MVNIGFWAIAGAGAAAGAYELISTAYGTGSSGTITFSSIPSTYKHLQVRAVVRSTRNSTLYGAIGCRFNGDTASNYAYHVLRGTGASVVSDNGPSQNHIRIAHVPELNSTSGSYGPFVLDILNAFSSSTYKTVRSLTGELDPAYGSNEVALRSGVWMNTAAITSVTIQDMNANFTTASRFSLYGIKG